jgi:hypothetical protein
MTILFSADVLKFFGRAKYLAAVSYIPLTAGNSLFWMLYTFFFMSILIAKATQWLFIVLITQIVVTIGLNAVLIPHWGVWGALIAVLAGMVAKTAMTAWFGTFHSEFKLPWKHITASLLPVILAVPLGIYSFQDLPVLQSLILKLFFAVVYSFYVFAVFSQYRKNAGRIRSVPVRERGMDNEVMGKTVRLLPPVLPVFRFNDSQLMHRDRIHAAINDGSLRFKPSVCFCGEAEAREIILYDAYGLNLPTVECLKCHTLRSKYFMDEESLNKFYNGEYYIAHMFTYATAAGGMGIDPIQYLGMEEIKGETILKWMDRNYPKWRDHRVRIAEIGCGAGGILNVFRKNGFQTVGCDWSEKYVKIGREQNGLDLRVGGPEVLKGDKYDLIVLSDLVEHLSDPTSFLKGLEEILSEKGIVYLNVPGVFGIGHARFGCNFRQFTKIEHYWCFTLQSIRYLFEKAGFQFISGDQYVRALFSRKRNKGHLYGIPVGYKYLLYLFLITLPLRKRLFVFDFLLVKSSAVINRVLRSVRKTRSKEAMV